MAGHGRLNIDDQLAALLAGGYNVEMAAQKLGVSTKTVWRRRKDPKFRAKVEERLDDLYGAYYSHLLRLGLDALQVHADIFKLQSGSKKDFSLMLKLSAAKSVNQALARAHELCLVMPKLAALDEAQEAREAAEKAARVRR